MAAADNPYRVLEQFGWQVYQEEQDRNIAYNGRPRLDGEAAAHIRERELRLRQFGDAAMAAAHRTGFPVPEVEARVKKLEDACVRVLLWVRDAPHPTPEQRRRMEATDTWENPAGAYLIEQLNRLGDEIDPVRRLAACFDGRIDQPQPEGVRTLADLLGELERREQVGQTDTADLDQWPGVRGLRSLALAWWRSLLTAASLKRFRFEFCVMVGQSIDQGNHAQLFEVATALLARRNTPPPYIPSASELDSEECLRAQEMARQTFPVPPAAIAGEPSPALYIGLPGPYPPEYRHPAPQAAPAAAEVTPAEGAALPSSTSAASSTGDTPQQQRRHVRREEERLRRLLKVQAGEHPRRRLRRTVECSGVNGIMWPLPSDLDLDPTATLRGDCAAALHALDKPEPPNVLGDIPAYRAVVRILPVLAEAVARLRGRPAPTFPVDTQDGEAARRYVETVLDWCEGKAAPFDDARAALPDDPVVRMQAAIARERRVQLTMSGPYLQDSFNWQAGVDRLWKRWDELFPDAVRPDKPICTNYAEASDAAVALLRALQSVRPTGAGGSMGMPPTAAVVTPAGVAATAVGSAAEPAAPATQEGAKAGAPPGQPAAAEEAPARRMVEPAAEYKAANHPGGAAVYKRGPQVKREKVEKRNQKIRELITAGVTDPTDIYDGLRREHTDLLFKNKKGDLISPLHMMQKYKESGSGQQ